MKKIGLNGVVVVVVMLVCVCAFLIIPEGRVLSEQDKLEIRGLGNNDGWMNCYERYQGEGTCHPVSIVRNQNCKEGDTNSWSCVKGGWNIRKPALTDVELSVRVTDIDTRFLCRKLSFTCELTPGGAWVWVENPRQRHYYLGEDCGKRLTYEQRPTETPAECQAVIDQGG